MTVKPNRPKTFQAGRGYTHADWDAVDSPEFTADDFARMKPAREVLPESFFEGLNEARKAGRPRVEKPKQAVTLRLDPDVIERFQQQGKDWRSRMSEALRKASGG
ncbi:BrnA antitoxin family protein [Rhizobium sp. C4]|uniref:BrnA antitoxin family protein n=1 Tax=Rhizobium sp. C4 TaxID=1349800 RepID=UPI001E572C80|nr:BrnA antitoxin family protein [Rhizobium sp. C4]MCD2173318.1 BrnA antitoxin family protein [Rhizobium sp. C4]